MNYDLRGMRYWAVPIVAAATLALAPGPSHARDAKELLLKSVGTTENVSPVIVEAIRHAAMDLTPEQRKLASNAGKTTSARPGTALSPWPTPTASAKTSGARSPRWNSSRRR